MTPLQTALREVMEERAPSNAVLQQGFIWPPRETAALFAAVIARLVRDEAAIEAVAAATYECDMRRECEPNETWIEWEWLQEVDPTPYEIPEYLSRARAALLTWAEKIGAKP